MAVRACLEGIVERSKGKEGSRLTLLALLFSRYSSMMLALEELAAVAVKTAAARPRRAALLPSRSFDSAGRACWARIAGSLGPEEALAGAADGAAASFQLASEAPERA